MSKILSILLPALLSVCVAINLAAQPPGHGHGNNGNGNHDHDNHGNNGHGHGNSCNVNLGDDLTICLGKTVTLDAKGDFETYQWSTGDSTRKITVDSSGTYSVTVTGKHQCTATDTIVITVDNNALKVTVPDQVQLTCADSCKSLKVKVRNGTAPYTIVWSNGDSTDRITVCDTTAAIYTVTVTDTFGCTNSDTAHVSFSGIKVDLGGDRYLTCGDSCTYIKMRLSHGSAPTTYAWSNGDSTSRITACGGSATYAVTVSDASGCTGADTINVVVSDSVCSPTGVLICHSDGDGDHRTLCIDTSELQSYLANGDSIGCCTDESSSSKSHHSHSSHHSNGNRLSANHRSIAESGKTVIEYSVENPGKVTVEVFNISGIKVSNLFSGNVDAKKTYRLDFMHGTMPSGMYICKISNAAGESYFEKVLLQKE